MKVKTYLKVLVFILAVVPMTSQASKFGQFGGKPLYLLDVCSNSIAGYSHASFPSDNALTGALSFYAQSHPNSLVSVCRTNTAYVNYQNGSVGGWNRSGGASAATCFTSTYMCFFRNNNY